MIRRITAVSTAIRGSANPLRGTQDGAAHDAEAHEGIDPRVAPIGYQRCAVEVPTSTRPNDSGDEIAAEADQSRNSERE